MLRKGEEELEVEIYEFPLSEEPLFKKTTVPASASLPHALSGVTFGYQIVAYCRGVPVSQVPWFPWFVSSSTDHFQPIRFREEDNLGMGARRNSWRKHLWRLMRAVVDEVKNTRLWHAFEDFDLIPMSARPRSSKKKDRSKGRVAYSPTGSGAMLCCVLAGMLSSDLLRVQVGNQPVQNLLEILPNRADHIPTEFASMVAKAISE